MRTIAPGRTNQLFKHVPEILNYRTMLYVGASPQRTELVGFFKSHHYIIDLIEIWKPYIEKIRKINKKRKYFRRIIRGDIRRVDEIIKRPYDVVVWWHGPEHVPEKDLKPTIKKLEAIAKKFVVMGCPEGEYKQPPIGGNLYEEHVSFLERDFFKHLGYETHVIYKSSRNPEPRGSNMLSWKYMREQEL